MPLPNAQDFGNEYASQHGYEVVGADGVVIPRVLEYDFRGTNPWVRQGNPDAPRDTMGNMQSDIVQVKQGAFVRTLVNTVQDGPPWGMQDEDDIYLPFVTSEAMARNIAVDGRRWFPISKFLGLDEEDAKAIDAYVNEGGFALAEADFSEVEHRVIAHELASGGSVTGRVRHDRPNYADRVPGQLDAELSYVSKEDIFRYLYGEFDADEARRRASDPDHHSFNPSAIAGRITNFDIDHGLVHVYGMSPANSPKAVTITVNIDATGLRCPDDRKVMADIAAVIAKHYPTGRQR